MKVLIKLLPLFFLFTIISCSSSDSSSDDPFSNVPSGEIVPVEQRNSVLTGFDDGPSSKLNAQNDDGQKWWKQVVSKITYNGCDGEEDEDITLDDTYFGFKPDGTLHVRFGQQGSTYHATDWGWADQAKSAIFLAELSGVEFSIRALNSNEVIYASSQRQSGSCTVVTWERFAQPFTD